MADEKKTYNIFVTGGSESAGLAVVKALLRNGHTVIASTPDADGALVIRQAGAIPVYPDLTREGEILSVLRMANVNVVVHAAPQVFGGVPQSDFDYNAHASWLVDSTNAVVHAAGKNEVDKLISISFGYLYDGHAGEQATEATPPVHDSTYDPMLKAEAAVLDGGIDGYVIRAGYIYGGNSYGTENIAEVVKNSRPVHKGTHPASWIHEDDLATAIIALIEADSEDHTLAEIINVADDQPQTPNEFANETGEVLGFSAVSFASPGIMKIVRGETLRDKLLEREVILDTTRIKEKYGWQPQYPTVEAGMDATALVWRMKEATDPTEYYSIYEDKAAEAIAALMSGEALQLPEEVEEEEEKPARKAPEPKKEAPAKAETPAPAADGPTPWNEDEAKREERRRRALERKKRRAEKQGG